MARTHSKSKAKKPLQVRLVNATGQVIEGMIPSGQLTDEDPALSIASELGKHKHLQPTPLP